MHLLINASELGRRRGGNETFVAGVVAGLVQLAAADHPWFRAGVITLLTNDWGTPHEVPPPCRQANLGRYRRLPFFMWQQTRAIRQLKADWYLSNFFFPPVLPCRGFVAVHDLSFMAHPEYFPAAIAVYMRLLTGRAVRKASRILTISEFSRTELIRFFPASARKVRVIPLAADARFVPAAGEAEGEEDRRRLEAYGVHRPYILALGNIHPRKNLARLLDAYMVLRERLPAAPTMVWSGLQRWDSSGLVQRAREAGVILTGFVADEHLPALYREAAMLVYPSLYEGFGLPVLEAMGCGTPVVASDTSSLPEVAGQAGLLVNPTDTGALADAMGRVATERALCGMMVRRGFEQAARFSWKRTASMILDELE